MRNNSIESVRTMRASSRDNLNFMANQNNNSNNNSNNNVNNSPNANLL